MHYSPWCPARSTLQIVAPLAIYITEDRLNVLGILHIQVFKCRYHIAKQHLHCCVDPKCDVHSLADSIFSSCSPSTLRIYSTSVCWTYEILHKMPQSSSSVWLDQKLQWVYWHPALRENKGLCSYSLCMEAGRLETASGHSLQVILHSWNYGEHTFWLSEADCFSVRKTATNCSDFRRGFVEDFVIDDKAHMSSRSWDLYQFWRYW